MEGKKAVEAVTFVNNNTNSDFPSFYLFFLLPIQTKVNEELDSIFVKLVTYVSDQTHSAGRKACLVAGIRHLRIIPSDDQLSMSSEKLEEQMKVII